MSGLLLDAVSAFVVLVTTALVGLVLRVQNVQRRK